MLITSYLIVILSSLTIPFKIVIAITFGILIKSNKSNELFQYYFIKAIDEIIYLTIRFVFHLLLIVGKDFMKTETGCWLELVFNKYISFIVLMLSVYFEFDAVFNLHRKLSNRFNFLNKLSVKQVAAFQIFCFSLFYVYKLIERMPTLKMDLKTNQTYYKIEFTPFRWTFFGYAFRLTNTITKDGISVLLLFIFNILIIIQIRKLMSNKKKMVVMGESNLQKRKRVEIKMIIIVVLSGSLNAAVHSLNLINYLIFLNREIDPVNDLIENIFFLLMHLFSFFIFYFLHKNFSKIVNRFLNQLYKGFKLFSKFKK